MLKVTGTAIATVTATVIVAEGGTRYLIANH